MKIEVFDEKGQFIGYQEAEAPTRDMTPYNAVEFTSTLKGITSAADQVQSGIGSLASLFDGSKTLSIGSLKAPLGVVLGGGVLAALALQHFKER